MSELIALLSKAPPGLVEAIVELVRGILAEDDPVRVAKATAAKLASETALRKALG